MRTKKRIGTRLLAMVLCLVMTLSVCEIALVPRAAAAPEPETKAPVNVTQGVTRQADPSTMDTYTKMLDFTTETRYAGRLWSDKSVYAYGYDDGTDSNWKNNTLTLTPADDGVEENTPIELDSDFLHVYSVLGSSLQIDKPAPADLVLALDISGSMGSPIQNESSGWVNTVNPVGATDKEKADGLGYYQGNDGATEPSKDKNGIPDKIVAVLPEKVDGGAGTKYNIETATNGQMAPSFTNYNEYLTFCNNLVDALKGKDSNNNGSLEDSELTEFNVDSIANYAKFLPAEIRKNETYQALYSTYQTYLQNVKAMEDSNAWLSDADNNRNAVWPCEEWDKLFEYDVVTDGKTERKDAAPDNPLCNANQAPNRMYYVIEAANAFIKRFLGLNEKNRISVVVYDSVATVLMPLAHYTTAADKADYLSAEKHHWQSWGKGQWACTVTANAKPTTGSYDDDENPFGDLLKGDTYTASVTSWGNTDTQAAVNAGLDILAQSKDSYDDLIQRTPILVLMTDGAANTIVTGSTDSLTTGGTISAAWTKGATKSTTTGAADGRDRYNDTDGMVLNKYEKDGAQTNRTYDLLNTSEQFKDQTSSGLTVYAAGNGHVYGSESDMPTRYTVVLHTLMSIAYQKTLVEEHYNNKEDYTESADWTKSLIYTIGFGLDKYSGDDIQTICAEILNPTDSFNPVPTESATEAHEKMYNAYLDWVANKEPASGTQEILVFNASSENSSLNDESNSLHPNSNTYEELLKFPIRQSDLSGGSVTVSDITRNIKYNQQYFTASLEGSGEGNDGNLSDVFDQILKIISGTIFEPVAGTNDLGVQDAVTYMDPMGKYMEVKDVKGLSLFGKYYNIVKTAVYDYQWNTAYKEAHKKTSTEEIDPGWYRGEPTTNDYKATVEDAEKAWAEGYVYRVGYLTAKSFVPTIGTITDEASPGVDKLRQTEYTFYRLDEETEVRQKLHANPAYLEEGQTEDDFLSGYKYDPSGDASHGKPGAYALSDLRIWVEDSGDYNVSNPGTETDANYDEALWINIPVNMLPLRKVTVSEDLSSGEPKYTYTTNMDAKSVGHSASFPLRVFYTVGVSDEVMEDGNRINVAGSVSPEYILQNKITTDVAAEARAVAKGNLEFFSNWYNPLSRYSSYSTNTTDYTFGDPVTSFSPSPDNRYYIFEKALPLHKAAYRYNGTEWVKVDQSESSASTFGGKLLAELSTEDITVGAGDGVATTDEINMALEDKSISANEGDFVLLESDLLKEIDADPKNDPFPSDGYYYLAIEYYELNKGSTKADPVQFVIARRGSEFGSGYASAGIKNGDMLCWHDRNGTYPDYPYLSATDTGDKSRGRDYIGAELDDKGNFTDTSTNGHPASKPANNSDYLSAGDWVVSAKPGGLRVGGLAQAIQSKGNGEGYTTYDDYAAERFPGQSVSVGYYKDNTTRTANNYYLPTISSTSESSGANVKVNVYLGNNGRLIVEDTTLLVTKLIDLPEGTSPDSNAEFNFQLYINGVTGKQSAVVVKYNETSKSWQRQFHYIDLELDTQLFLQTQDGQKAMVDGSGRRVISNPDTEAGGYVYADDTGTKCEKWYYVYIGKNKNPESVGASNTAFRVYHNENVDEYKMPEDIVTVKTSDGAGIFKAKTVYLVSESKYTTDWQGETKLNPSDTGFNIEGHYDGGTLPNFELLTINPNINTATDITITTPYRTISSYWTVDIVFGENANKDDGSGIPTTSMTTADLYDQIVPTTDGSDYFNERNNNTTNDDIVANTAEFTLRNGYGLLFSGITSGAAYRATEKLTDAQLEAGYTLKELVHNQDAGSSTTYRPGEQSIPVYMMAIS